MYAFLFDQTYITMAIFGLLIFLIMFLWRKITIIEGHIFILEKRVDTIKKTDRIDSINKNIEKADIVMNEIFKDSTEKNTYCNKNLEKCPIENLKNNINNIDLPTIDNEIINYINIINSEEPNKELSESISITNYINDNTKVLPSIIKEKIEVNNDNSIETFEFSSKIIENKDNKCSVDILSSIDNTDNDNMSISSDITFGNDVDKTMTKKYKNMNVEKLREECKEKSLNIEGTKAILISRLLEHNKKQK